MSTLIPVFRWGRSYLTQPSPVKVSRPFAVNPGRAGPARPGARPPSPAFAGARRGAFVFVSAPPTRTPS